MLYKILMDCIFGGNLDFESPDGKTRVCYNMDVTLQELETSNK